MKYLEPFEYITEGITFRGIPQDAGRSHTLRIGWEILRGDNLLSAGVSQDSHNLDHLLRVASAAFWHNGVGPDGHAAEWYADVMMRLVYEKIPFRPVAPEGGRVPGGRPLRELIEENPVVDDDALVVKLFECGCLYFIVARHKTGKSLLNNELMDAVATGGVFLGRQARQGRVLWLALEDSWRTIYRRWKRRYPDADIPDNIIVDQEPWRLTEANLEATAQWLRENEIALLIIDPAIVALPPHNAFDPVEARAAMEPFRQLARLSNVVIILTAHHRKAEGDHGDQISGSHQYAASVDGYVELRRDPGMGKGQRRITFEGRDWPDIPDEVVEINSDTLKLHHVGVFDEVKEQIQASQTEEDARKLAEIVNKQKYIAHSELERKSGLPDRRRRAALKYALTNDMFAVEEITGDDGKPLKGKPKAYRAKDS